MAIKSNPNDSDLFYARGGVNTISGKQTKHIWNGENVQSYTSEQWKLLQM